MAIREAVIALAAVTLRDRPLVFGGHPAISPLVEHAARSLGALANVHIYQSRFFEDRIPEVARKFPNLHWTPKTPEAAPTEAESLESMRRGSRKADPFYWSQTGGPNCPLQPVEVLDTIF